MTEFGSAFIRVGADVQQAISEMEALDKAVGKVFDSISRSAKQFGDNLSVDQNLGELKVVTSVLGDIDRTLGSIASKTKGINLAAQFREAVDELRVLREQTAATLGDPVGTVGEQRAIQESLFRQQTQQAHEAAVAKEQAYARAAAAAKKNVGEEKAVQESLFRLQTQEAHDAAVAKEKAYTESVKAAEKAAIEERRIQEKLGAELSAAINRQHPELARQRQAIFDRSVAEASGLKGIDTSVKAASTGIEAFAAKLQQGAGFGRIFGNAIQGVTGFLGKFGLTARDAGIALGAGFLTTGPAIILLIGVKLVEALLKAVQALAKFIFEAAKLGSQLTQFQQVTERAVGSASRSIREFAENAASDFGITEARALQFINKTSRLFQSFGGITKEASARLSEGLVEVAEVLRITSASGLSLDQALDRIFNTVSGNIEGLRDFNIFMTEISLKQVAAAHGIELTSETLDAQERALLATIAAYDQAIKAVDDYNATNLTIDQRLEQVQAQIQTLIAQIGQELAPIFLKILTVVKNFLDGLLRMIQGFKDFRDEIKAFIRAHPALQKALDLIVESFRKSQPVFDAAVKVLGVLSDENKKAEVSSKNLREEQEEAIKALRQKNLEEGRSAEGLERLIELEKKAAEARREATKAIEDASRALARAQEDGARRVEEANRDLDKAIRDQAEKNADALDAVADAEREAERAIFDARERLADAKLKRDRSIRDAEERLAELRIEAARKVDNAERALAEARRRRNDELLSAQLSLEEALARGDAEAERRARLELAKSQDSRSIKDAERNLQEAEADRLRDIAKAERDLLEARIDGAKAVEEAQRNLDRVIADSQERIKDALEDLRRTRREGAEAVEEALRRLHEIEVQNNRALFDAQERLNEAHIEGAQRIKETQKEVDELREKYGLVGESLEMLNTLLGAAILKQKLLNGEVADLVLLNEELIKQQAYDLGYAAGGAASSTFGRAHGGPVMAGSSYFVGERGPELFIPNSSGSIVSNERLVSLLLDAIRNPGNYPTASKSQFPMTIFWNGGNPDALAAAITSRFAQRLNI